MGFPWQRGARLHSLSFRCEPHRGTLNELLGSFAVPPPPAVPTCHDPHLGIVTTGCWEVERGEAGGVLLVPAVGSRGPLAGVS